MPIPLLLIGAAVATAVFLKKTCKSNSESSDDPSSSEGSNSSSDSGNSGIDSDSICYHVEGHSFGEGRSYYGDRNRDEDLTGFRDTFGDDNTS